MSGGLDLINEMDFRSKIKTMQDRELSEFTALTVYDTCNMVSKHSKRITALENRDRRWVGIGAGIGAVFAGVFYLILNFFRG